MSINKMSIPRVAGAALALSSALYLGYEAYTDPGSDLLNNQIKITAQEANPSTLMSDGFKAFQDTMEIAGIGVLSYGAVRLGKSAFDPKYQAIHEIAASKNRTSKNIIKKIGGGAAAAAVITFGTYGALAQGTAASQRVAAEPFLELAGNNKQIQVISNSPQPELFNAPAVPKAVYKAVDPKTGKFGDKSMNAVPVGFSFHNIFPDVKNPNKKILSSTYWAPADVIDLKNSTDNCNTVDVVAPKELGKGLGDTFYLDGLKVTVAQLTEGKTGVNLFPVGMTSEDASKCLAGGASLNPNLLLVEGSKEDVEKVLKDVGVNVDGEDTDLENRAYVLPIEKMLDYSQKTGENTVNGLVSLALIIGSGFIYMAINGQSRNEYLNDRLINAVRRANGISKKDIMNIYADRADSVAFRSAAVGIGGVVLVTASANMTMAGASMGLDMNTSLASLAYIWTAGRLTNAVVARQELKKANIAEGQGVS